VTRPVYIYTLCERGKDEVRYVGQTVNPEQRLKAHVGDSRLESSHPKERWIAEVLMMGSDIEMRIVEECTVESAGDREKHWIDFHLENGFALTNISRGAASRFACADAPTDTRSKVTGFRLTETELLWLDEITSSNGFETRTDLIRWWIRRERES
jgi:GIY-YIG catalytic domain